MPAALSPLADACCVLAFVVISLVFLGLFLLGWRLAARWAAVRVSGRG